MKFVFLSEGKPIQITLTQLETFNNEYIVGTAKEDERNFLIQVSGSDAEWEKLKKLPVIRLTEIQQGEYILTDYTTINYTKIIEISKEEYEFYKKVEI